MNVIVVEDEIRVRKGIVSKIERLVGECKVIGECKNGEEAYKMIESLIPDIVVTDIKMPGMNGLLLIEKAKQINPLIKFIIISGYDDFEYARRAIHLGVFDYMLKPVVNKELYTALENICKKIKSEKEEFRKADQYKSQLKMDCITKKNCIMAGYFTNKLVSKESIIRHICNKGETLERKYYTAIKIFYAELDQEVFPKELLQFVIANVLEEIFSKHCFCLGYYRDDDGEEICGFMNHDIVPYRLEKLVGVYINTIAGILKGKLCVAVGRSYESFEAYYQSLQEAELIIKQKIIFPGLSMLLWSDYLSVCENDYSFSEADRRLIVRHLMFLISEREELKVLVSGILDDMFEQKICYANIKTVYLDISILILNEVKSRNHGRYREIYDLDVDQLVSRNATIESLKIQCFGLIDSIYEIVKSEGAEGGRKIVADIQKRMKEEYFHDLKLSSFAGEYYINHSYLSTLFLQETGENFTKYLTDIRINKAKELLETTTFSTERVAEFVGYNDRGYFTGVFQKKVGISPAEYRRSMRNE